jgi:TonB family protein
VVLSWVVPSYPDIARQARVTGVVTVRLPLDRDGRPTDAVCLRGIPLLAEAAIKAARKWEFESSDEAEREAIIEFVFQLMPVHSPALDLKSRFLSPSVFAVRAEHMEIQAITLSRGRTRTAGRVARVESARARRVNA